MAGWVSAKRDEISLQCYPSLCLGYSGIPQRGVSHWSCVSSAAAGFRSAWHLHVGGGNRMLGSHPGGVVDLCRWQMDGWVFIESFVFYLFSLPPEHWSSAFCLVAMGHLFGNKSLAGALAVGLLEGFLCPCQCVTYLTQSTVTSLVPLQAELSFNGLFTFPKGLCPVGSVCLSVCTGRKSWCWLTDLVCSPA